MIRFNTIKLGYLPIKKPTYVTVTAIAGPHISYINLRIKLFTRTLMQLKEDEIISISTFFFKYYLL
jgi:hypothetical protein